MTPAVVGEHDDRGGSDWSPTPVSSPAAGQSGRDWLWNWWTHQNCYKMCVRLVQIHKISETEDRVSWWTFSGSSNVLKTHQWAAVWESPQQLFRSTSQTSLSLLSSLEDAFAFWLDSNPISEPVLATFGTLNDWETFDLPSQGPSHPKNQKTRRVSF